MADEHLRIWEKLFGPVLSIFDEAVAAGAVHEAGVSAAEPC